MKTHQEVKKELLAAGKISEKGMEKARQEMGKDPGWQVFINSQPKQEQA